MMATPHKIAIVIKPDGEMHTEVQGVAGPACGPLGEWLDTLGKVVRDEHTDDYDRSVFTGQALATESKLPPIIIGGDK